MQNDDNDPTSITAEMTGPDSCPWWARYGVALTGVALGWGCGNYLFRSGAGRSCHLFSSFPVTAFTAWYGGIRPALLATIFGALIADWFFMEPFHTLRLRTASEAAALATFIAVSFVIASAIQAMHRARRRVEAETVALATEIQRRRDSEFQREQRRAAGCSSLSLDGSCQSRRKS
jgi:K+-sensing histidine kinase KdpD